MRKTGVYLIILFIGTLLLNGCGRTFETLKSYIDQGWQTLLRWDEDFRKNCW